MYADRLLELALGIAATPTPVLQQRAGNRVKFGLQRPFGTRRDTKLQLSMPGSLTEQPVAPQSLPHQLALQIAP